MVQNKPIYGWASESEVASEVYDGQFRSLLQGNLVFAYKTSSNNRNIKFLVVTKIQEGFRYGLITSGWTCYYPVLSAKHLIETLTGDLKKDKIETYIIDNFINSIKNYE